MNRQLSLVRWRTDPSWTRAPCAGDRRGMTRCLPAPWGDHCSDRCGRDQEGRRHSGRLTVGWLTAACAGRPWGLVCVRAAGQRLRTPHQPRLWPLQREQSCSSAFRGTFSYRLPVRENLTSCVRGGRPVLKPLRSLGSTTRHKTGRGPGPSALSFHVPDVPRGSLSCQKRTRVGFSG